MKCFCVSNGIWCWISKHLSFKHTTWAGFHYFNKISNKNKSFALQLNKYRSRGRRLPWADEAKTITKTTSQARPGRQAARQKDRRQMMSSLCLSLPLAHRQSEEGNELYVMWIFSRWSVTLNKLAMKLWGGAGSFVNCGKCWRRIWIVSNG